MSAVAYLSSGSGRTSGRMKCSAASEAVGSAILRLQRRARYGWRTHCSPKKTTASLPFKSSKAVPILRTGSLTIQQICQDQI